MAHFLPLRWVIELPDNDIADLERDPVTKARFVHEYIHYVQCLTGTIGRHILVEIARVSIFAGLHKAYGWPPPKNYGQIDLADVLGRAEKVDFIGTEPAAQYQEFDRELRFALAAHMTRYNGAVASSSPFVSTSHQVGQFKVDDFVHVVSQHPTAGSMLIPVTDRVVFENMARQVQKNFLRFNNDLDTTAVDDHRLGPSADLPYVCLHDHLRARLAEGEDPAKWTITLCQIALLCRNPGTAMRQMWQHLRDQDNCDLDAFTKVVGRDDWFKGEFNHPPLQKTLDELIGGLGTAMRMTENWELREFTKCIATASNTLVDRYDYFADPLLEWKTVASWVSRFGCPPVICRDGRCTEIMGAKTSMPWHDYFTLADRLLS